MIVVYEALFLIGWSHLLLTEKASVRIKFRPHEFRITFMNI